MNGDQFTATSSAGDNVSPSSSEQQPAARTSAGGCPFKVRLSTSNDGQALVVKEICHDHNHEPGKKLHEEPRRLYRNKTNNKTTVRKQVRCVVNKQRTDSGSATPTCLPPKSQNIQPDTGVVIRLAQSPFHNLQLHNQQQQLQIKIQLENHLQQQRIKQKQLEEVIHFDSPDHIDTPDHLSSPDLSSNFESLGNIFSSAEQYSYLPPSPISPSSSVSSTSQAGYTSEEEGVIEPIVDLDVALEEALGDLDSVSSMDLEDKFSFVPIGGSRKFMQSADVEPSLTALPISSSPSTSNALASHHDDDPCAPPPTKRFKGRPRKQSFTGSMSGGGVDIPDLDPLEKEEETDFIGFSPVKSQDEPAAMANTSVDVISEQDITHANNMAMQLHVYKPGIDFVSGAKLECLDARDNKWYHCKIVEVDWGELDILVHYERWSVRFDEWLKMDSTRIRPISLSKKDKSKQFKVGEKVLGYWAPDSCYYYGEIIRIPSEDHYEVLFYDGYTKSLRSSQLKKTDGQLDIGSYMSKEGTVLGMSAPKAPDMAPATPDMRRKSIGSNASGVESPPVTPVLAATPKGWAYEPEVNPSKVNIFSVEILEAKRKTKRKPDVEELFKSLKKKRKLEEMLEDDNKPLSPMRDNTPSVTPEAKHRKVEPLEKPSDDPGSHAENQPKRKTEPTSDQINLREYKVSEAVSTPKVSPKRSDRYFEIILGDGWKKIARKRPNVSYWDVFYVNPVGIKSNNRLQFSKNAEKYPCPISVDQVDFSYKTAKLEFEAKHGGVLIKQDSFAPSSEASFSEIYEAPVEPFGGKKINFDTNEVAKTEPPESVTSDVEAESSSSSSESYSSAEDNDEIEDSSESEEAEEKSLAGVEATEEADDHNSSSGTDEDSDSDIESRDDDKVPSVRLSEFLPESDLKEDKKTDSALHNLSSSPRETATCLSPKKLKSQLRVGTPALKRELLKNIGTSGSPSVKENFQTPAMSKGTHPYTTRKQSIGLLGSSAVDVLPKTDTNSFQCPQKSCEKSFRKENLLQMHMKHYHPDLIKKDCLNAPNVADLACARVAGDQLGSISPSSSSTITLPSSSFVSSSKQKSEVQSRKASRQVLVGMESKKEQTNTSKLVLESKSGVDEECNKTGKDSVKGKDEMAASGKATPEATEPEGIKPAPIYSETYSLRTRKPDSVSESVENDDETTDGPGDSQSYEEAIINCICKSTEEDGLMLQCDICLCWQHAGCYNIEREDQVPESYTCSLCDYPKGERSSKKFRHNQDWLKEGKLPRFPFCTGKPNTKLQYFVKRGHELSANVYQLTQLIHSLRLKLNISKAADHPKFVMWHKKWETTKPEVFNFEGENDAQSAMLSNLPSSVSVCNQIKQSDEETPSTSGVPKTALSTSSSQKTFLQNLPTISEVCLSSLPLVGTATSGNQTSQSTLSAEVVLDTLTENIADIDSLKENKDAADLKNNLLTSLPRISTNQFYSSQVECHDTQDNVQCNSGALSFAQNKDETNDQSSSLPIEENLDIYGSCPIMSDSSATSISQTLFKPDPDEMTKSIGEDKNIAPAKESSEKETSPQLCLKNIEDVDKSLNYRTAVLETENSSLAPIRKAPFLTSNKSNDNLKSPLTTSFEFSKTTLSNSSQIADSKLVDLTKASQNSLSELPEATLPLFSDNLSFKERETSALSADDGNIKNNILFVVNKPESDPFVASTDEIIASNTCTKDYVGGEHGEEGASNAVGNADINMFAKSTVSATEDVATSTIEVVPVADRTSLQFTEAKVASLESGNSDQDSMTVASEIVNVSNVTSCLVDGKNNLAIDLESRPKPCEVDEPSLATVCNTFNVMDSKEADGSKEVVTMPALKETYSLNSASDAKPFDLANDELIKPQEIVMVIENVEEITGQTTLIEAPISNQPSCSLAESTSAVESRSSRDSYEAASKIEGDNKFANDDPETDPAVSLDDEGDDFNLELGVSGMNDVPDVSELLAHSSLEHFDDQPNKEIIPSHHHAPIIPQAERIEPTNCKLNLLQHVESVQNHVFRRFDYIEKELNALEAEMGLTSAISKEEEALLNNNEGEDRDAATLQSRALVQLIMKDLKILKKVSDFSDRKDIQ